MPRSTSVWVYFSESDMNEGYDSHCSFKWFKLGVSESAVRLFLCEASEDKAIDRIWFGF